MRYLSLTRFLRLGGLLALVCLSASAIAATAVPGRIEAENYNSGGEGIAFHVAHGDWGSAQPRPDSMDISADAAGSAGYVIGWIDPDQWFVYDIRVSTEGTYSISPRISAPWQPGALHIEVDGVNVTGSLSFNTTGGWVSLPPSQQFFLAKGAHQLKVYMEGHGFGFDCLDVQLVSARPTATFLRGINFGGPQAGAVVVNGNQFMTDWDASNGGLIVSSTLGGSVNSWVTAIPDASFSPAVTDAGLSGLLNHHVSVTNDGLKISQAACNGTYQVYTYQMENNASFSRSFNINVQGVIYDTVSLEQNSWVKDGPYTAVVSNAVGGCNGSIDINLTRNTGDASIMGLEIYTTDNGSLPPVTAPPPSPSPTPLPGWVLTFDEEFDHGLSLYDSTTGTGRWDTQYHNGDRTIEPNGELEFYMDQNFGGPCGHPLGINPFSITGDVLQIEAARADQAIQPCIKNLPYTSGVLTTFHSFHQTYGRFEIRAQFPPGQGLWPAFWMLPLDETWPPELDVIEMNGGHVAGETIDRKTYAHFGAIDVDGAQSFGDWVPLGFDSTQGMHTYAVEWDVSQIVYFVDGHELYRRPTPSAMHKDMYLQLNLAVGGNWFGPPDQFTQFPAHMYVDYVRAYKKAQ